MNKIQTILGLLLFLVVLFSMNMIFGNTLKETFSEGIENNENNENNQNNETNQNKQNKKVDYTFLVNKLNIRNDDY